MEVLVPKNGDEFIFSRADGTVQLGGKDQAVRTSMPTRKFPDQGEDPHDASQGEADGSDPAQQQWTDDDEARDDFGIISGSQHLSSPRSTKGHTSCAQRRIMPVTTEVVRRTNRVCCWKNRTDDRTLMVTGSWRGHVPVLPRSQYWTESLQMVTRGPRSDWQNFKQHPGPIIYGQKCGHVCRKALNKRNDGTGLLKKPKVDSARKLRGFHHIDPEDVEFKDTIKTCAKSGKCRWNPPCHASCAVSLSSTIRQSGKHDARTLWHAKVAERTLNLMRIYCFGINLIFVTVFISSEMVQRHWLDPQCTVKTHAGTIHHAHAHKPTIFRPGADIPRPWSRGKVVWDPLVQARRKVERHR